MILTLTRAAERAVYAAARRGDVPALRVQVLDDRPASASGNEADFERRTLVTTEPARSLGPGEIAISRGAATVYVSEALARRYQQATLDLHDREAVDAPLLVIRGQPAGGGRSDEPVS